MYYVIYKFVLELIYLKLGYRRITPCHIEGYRLKLKALDDKASESKWYTLEGTANRGDVPGEYLINIFNDSALKSRILLYMCVVTHILDEKRNDGIFFGSGMGAPQVLPPFFAFYNALQDIL